MRKVSSAPSIVGLAQLQGSTGSSQPLTAQAFGQSSQRAKREQKQGEGFSLLRLGSGPGPLDGGTYRRANSTKRAALHAFAPPPSLLDEADQLVMEAFQPQGIFGSGQCLELYGKVSSAPDLRAVADGEPAQTGPQPNTKTGQLVGGAPEFGGDERLAECLATPFTGEDKNLGEIVDDEARQAMKQAQLRTQLRYAAETMILEDDEENEVRRTANELDDPLKPESTPQQTPYRRKRRLSDDVYAYLQSLGIDVEPSQAGADDKLSCPETLAALRSVFGSWDDISNRLHLEDHQPMSEGDMLHMLRNAPSVHPSSEFPPAQAWHANGSPSRHSLHV